MDYRAYDPPDDLSDFVRCFWTLQAPASTAPARQRIVPDGCMEMIFHCGDHYRQHRSDGTSVVQPRCFVFGQVVHPLEIEPVGRTDIFAARFHVDGFTPFTERPLADLADTATDLADLFGPAGSRLAQQVVVAVTVEERMAHVGAFLRSVLAERSTADRLVAHAVATIAEAEGTLSIADVAERVQVNRRRLERRFLSDVGLSPKQLARIVRLQGAVARLSSGRYERLTDLAHEAGYHDQAHFIRDFRDFTGQPPGAFFSDNLALSGLFQTRSGVSHPYNDGLEP